MWEPIWEPKQFSRLWVISWVIINYQHYGRTQSTKHFTQAGHLVGHLGGHQLKEVAIYIGIRSEYYEEWRGPRPKAEGRSSRRDSLAQYRELSHIAASLMLGGYRGVTTLFINN